MLKSILDPCKPVVQSIRPFLQSRAYFKALKTLRRQLPQNRAVLLRGYELALLQCLHEKDVEAIADSAKILLVQLHQATLALGPLLQSEQDVYCHQNELDVIANTLGLAASSLAELQDAGLVARILNNLGPATIRYFDPLRADFFNAYGTMLSSGLLTGYSSESCFRFPATDCEEDTKASEPHSLMDILEGLAKCAKIERLHPECEDVEVELLRKAYCRMLQAELVADHKRRTLLHLIAHQKLDFADQALRESKVEPEGLHRYACKVEGCCWLSIALLLAEHRSESLSFIVALQRLKMLLKKAAETFTETSTVSEWASDAAIQLIECESSRANRPESGVLFDQAFVELSSFLQPQSLIQWSYFFIRTPRGCSKLRETTIYTDATIESRLTHLAIAEGNADKELLIDMLKDALSVETVTFTSIVRSLTLLMERNLLSRKAITEFCHSQIPQESMSVQLLETCPSKLRRLFKCIRVLVLIETDCYRLEASPDTIQLVHEWLDQLLGAAKNGKQWAATLKGNDFPHVIQPLVALLCEMTFKQGDEGENLDRKSLAVLNVLRQLLRENDAKGKDYFNVCQKSGNIALLVYILELIVGDLNSADEHYAELAIRCVQDESLRWLKYAPLLMWAQPYLPNASENDPKNLQAGADSTFQAYGFGNFSQITPINDIIPTHLRENENVLAQEAQMRKVLKDLAQNPFPFQDSLPDETIKTAERAKVEGRLFITPLDDFSPLSPTVTPPLFDLPSHRAKAFDLRPIKVVQDHPIALGTSWASPLVRALTSLPAAGAQGHKKGETAGMAIGTPFGIRNALNMMRFEILEGEKEIRRREIAEALNAVDAQIWPTSINRLRERFSIEAT